MDPGTPSRTAEHVALFRAIESARPASERLFDDPLAARFIRPRLRAVAAASRVGPLRRVITAAIDRRWPGPREFAVVRTRMIDDATAAALEAGAEQIVILGAGYDSRAYRLPAARAVDVFEVDHPATQAAKRRVIEAVCGGVPTHVRFVAIDFDRDPLGATLGAAGLRADALTLFLWEGVLSYLSPEAIDATLGWMASATRPHSRVVFTYVDGTQISAADPGPAKAWLDAVARGGEPFRSGLDPVAVPEFLRERGLRLLSDESTADALGRYRPGARMASFYRVAIAEAAG